MFSQPFCHHLMEFPKQPGYVMDRYIVPNLIFSAQRSAVRSGEGQVTFSSPALMSSTRSPVELTTSWTQGIDRIR